jgi:PAS domain S-box-containing protein
MCPSIIRNLLAEVNNYSKFLTLLQEMKRGLTVPWPLTVYHSWIRLFPIIHGSAIVNIMDEQPGSSKNPPKAGGGNGRKKSRTQLRQSREEHRTTSSIEALEVERRKTEEMLRKERETFFYILQKAPYGVILIDGDGKYRYVNPEFTNVTGYTLEDVPSGRDLMRKAYPDPEYREKVRVAWKTDILQKGVTWAFSFVRKDRQVREIEFKPTLLDDGRIIIMLSDITKRKRAEDALRKTQQELDLRVRQRTAELLQSNLLLKQEIAERERAEMALRVSEARYRSLVKRSSDGIFIFDPKTGKVLEANDQFLKMLGYKEEDVESLMLRDIVVFEDRATRAETKRALESGQDVHGLRRYRSADGSFLEVEVGVTFIGDEDQQVAMVNVRDVTERRRAERALKESEDRYRTIFETTGCATCIIEEEMTLSLVNTEFEKLSGYSKDEIEGRKNWIEFLEPKEVERLTRYHYLRRLDPVAAPRNYELQFVTRSGQMRTMFMTVALIPGTDKSVGSLLDITDRERAENALRESDRRYRTLFEESRDGIYINTLDGKFIDGNQSMLDLFGYTREEMLQVNAGSMYLDSVDRARFQEDMMEKNFVRDYEVRFKRKDGSEIDCLLTSTFWRASDDRVLGYQGIIHDITERKKAEEALRAIKDELEVRVTERTAELRSANERLMHELTRRKRVEEMLRKGAERYRDLFQNSPVGIYRVNADGRILMANQALVRMLGYNTFTDITTNEIEEDDYEPNYLQADFRKRLESDGRVRGYEATWKRPDGTIIFVSENARSVKSEDGSVIYYEGTVSDISEQKKAEEKIEAYQEELRSLASELSLAEERERRRISSMLHDNIGQILALAKIKLGSLIDPESHGMIHLEEVRHLIEQAIKYTRSLTFELSPPILYELGFEAALEWLGEQMQEQHGFVFTFENDNEPKQMDEEIRIFLFTSVRELLVNTGKHAGATCVTVAIRKSGDEVVIEVEDNGVGFSPAGYERGFGGYGLFSIRERLKHLGGRIEINSSPGKGTSIRLTVPSKTKKHQRRGQNGRPDNPGGRSQDHA